MPPIDYPLAAVSIAPWLPRGTARLRDVRRDLKLPQAGQRPVVVPRGAAVRRIVTANTEDVVGWVTEHRGRSDQRQRVIRLLGQRWFGIGGESARVYPHVCRRNGQAARYGHAVCGQQAEHGQCAQQCVDDEAHRGPCRCSLDLAYLPRDADHNGVVPPGRG